MFIIMPVMDTTITGRTSESPASRYLPMVLALLLVSTQQARAQSDTTEGDPERSPHGGSLLDSLDLQILATRVEQALVKVSQNSLVRRLIPRIYATASFGVKDVVFLDPLTADPYLLPHDAFRLTISLPITEIFDFTKQQQARLELQRLKTEYKRARIAQLKRRDGLAEKMARLNRQLKLLEKEEPIRARLVNYFELLFHQGKTDYDTLVHARLQLLSLKRSILQLQQRIADAQQELR